MTNKLEDDYAQNVIWAWDEASGNFKKACHEASREYSLAAKSWILDEDNETILLDTIKIKWAKETIDGVGTKVQIYQNQFENFFKQRENWDLETSVLRENSIDLWYRMLMDLIAMNADDLRNGELAIGITDIIDINFFVGPKPNDDKRRWNLLQDTLSEAFRRVIKTTEIAITAWETAILWESRKTKKLNNITQKSRKEMLKVLEKSLDKNSIENIKKIIEQEQEEIRNLMEEIEFNIWWTALWLRVEDKLIPLDTYDTYDIIAFQETSKDGIIGPRSNGITKIRDDMELIMGEWWEDKTFEDFVLQIGEEKSEKIPKEVRDTCKGKKMRDIATGTTTVFNPFIANKLLWWLEWKPKAQIAKLIHVTGNPIKKITEGIGDKNYILDLQLDKVTTPQIITLLQIALDIPDDQAMNKWNMGIPYAIVAHKADSSSIIEEAARHGLKAEIRGSVNKRKDWEEEKKNTISGVWLGKSKMEF